MAKKRLVLTFPPEIVERPIIAMLVRNYDILTNILRAQVHEGEIGKMLVEMEGDQRRLRSGIKYLEDLGVLVEDAIKDIELEEEACVHCGACTAICVPGALKIGAPEWKLELDKDKCILCGFCVEACPIRIITVKF